MSNLLKNLIIYVHGWNSSCFSNKASILQKNFRNVYNPTLPNNAAMAMNLLEQNI
jgi:predicted esterase YcpF (UPF0227 family)